MVTWAETQPRSQVWWSGLNILSSSGLVEAPIQLQVSVIYLVLAGLSHRLLSISVHSRAQMLSHQEVPVQFQCWRLSGDTLGLVHGCPCATCPQPFYSQGFSSLYISPALLSSRRQKERCKSHPWVLSSAVHWPARWQKRLWWEGSALTHLSFKWKWCRFFLNSDCAAIIISSYQTSLFSPHSLSHHQCFPSLPFSSGIFGVPQAAGEPLRKPSPLPWAEHSGMPATWRPQGATLMQIFFSLPSTSPSLFAGRMMVTQGPFCWK